MDDELNYCDENPAHEGVVKVGAWIESDAHIVRALQLWQALDSTIVLPDFLLKALFAMVTKEPAVPPRERLAMPNRRIR